MATLTELFEAGFSGPATRLLTGGVSPLEAAARLSLEFPQWTRTQVLSALNRLEAGGAAGRSYQQLEWDQSLYRADIPVLPGLGAGYQYWVRVECKNVVSGRNFGYLVAVNCGTNCTRGQVIDSVERMRSDERTYVGIMGHEYPTEEGDMECSDTIVAAWRAL